MTVQSTFGKWVAAIKSFFTGKPSTAQTVSYNTQVTHRKLRIPDSPEKKVFASRKQSFSETAVD